MKLKKLLLIAGLVATTIAFITACAPSTPAAAPTTAPPAAPTTVPAAAPTTAPPVSAPTTAPALAGELNVWVRFPEIGDYLKKIGATYTASHPNVKITVTLFDQRAIDEKLAIAVPAGEAADLFELDDYGAYTYQAKALLEPLPTDLADYNKAHVIKSVVASATDDKGVMFTAPFYYYAQGLFYNKDMFAAAGLSGCPKTLDEEIQYAKKLTTYDASGKVSRSGLLLRLAGGGYGITEKFWAQAMIPYGVAPFEKVGDKWRAGYDNDGGRAALQLYLDALYNWKIDSFDLKHDAEGFGLGAGAMFQRESWVLGYLAQNAPKINYASCLMPKGPKGWGTVFTAGSLSVPKSSKVKNLAWDFVKYSLSEENQNLLAIDTGWQPVRSDVNYSSVYKQYPQFQTILEAFSTPGYDTQPYPLLEPTNEILTKFADRLSAALNNASLAKDPAAVADTVHKMAQETNQTLDSYGLLAK